MFSLSTKWSQQNRIWKSNVVHKMKQDEYVAYNDSVATDFLLNIIKFSCMCQYGNNSILQVLYLIGKSFSHGKSGIESQQMFIWMKQGWKSPESQEGGAQNGYRYIDIYYIIYIYNVHVFLSAWFNKKIIVFQKVYAKICNLNIYNFAVYAITYPIFDTLMEALHDVSLSHIQIRTLHTQKDERKHLKYFQPTKMTYHILWGSSVVLETSCPSLQESIELVAKYSGIQ